MIGGDVATDGLGLDGAGRAALAGCDIVIHSAATVAFDSPLDSAVEVNLSHADVDALDRAFPPGAATGLRYPEFQLKAMGI